MFGEKKPLLLETVRWFDWDRPKLIVRSSLF